MPDNEEFFCDDMQMVRAKAVRVVKAAVDTDGDATAVMATIIDRSPLFPAVMDATDNIAAWAGTLAIVAAELAAVLAQGLGQSVEDVLLDAMRLRDSTDA